MPATTRRGSSTRSPARSTPRARSSTTCPDRLERFHYDLVATTTFHADEAQALVHGRVPVVAMLVGPGYVELVHEIAGLKAGSRVGLVCASERGAENMAETLALSGTTGVELISAPMDDEEGLALVDRTADVILLSREAIAKGLDTRFERPERIRQWSYEFDPAGLEFLRRAVEHVVAGAPDRGGRRRSVTSCPDAGAAGRTSRRGKRYDLDDASPRCRRRAARRGVRRGPAACRAAERARRRRSPERTRRRDRRPRPPPRDRPRAHRQLRARGPAERLRRGPRPRSTTQLGPQERRRRPRSAWRRSSARSRSGPTSSNRSLLLDVAAENPASQPLHPLVDPGPVAAAKAYAAADARRSTASFRDEGDARPTARRFSTCSARRRATRPTSLAGQLRYARDRWGDILPPALAARLVAGEDLLAEEERGLHLRFGGGGGWRPAAVGEAPSFAGADVEAERFSDDREWMPRLVLAAKSTYVWLDQLSRALRPRDPDARRDSGRGAGRDGPARDQRASGSSGCGSARQASEKIKRWRGNADAVASAYSLDDYRIADDLGGEAAHANLRDRAAARGIRLASATWCPTTWGSTRAG